MSSYPPFVVDADTREVRAVLSRLAARLSDLTPAMEDVGRVLANIAEDAFESETDPWGNAWEELSAAYVARPRERGGRGGEAHPILQVSGGSGLAGSLSHGGDAHSAFVALGKVYGAAVTLGNPDAGLPERRVLPVSGDGELAPVARDAILDELAAYLSVP